MVSGACGQCIAGLMWQEDTGASIIRTCPLGKTYHGCSSGYVPYPEEFIIPAEI
jgi:hypothetical protein